MASAETFLEEVPQEFIDLQAWLLTSFDDPEKRKGILSRNSLNKLAELKNVRAWIIWLKELFDKAEADGRAAAQREIERSSQAPVERTKDKWQVRVRIVCASHSIRPKALTAWNKGSNWIKLSAGGRPRSNRTTGPARGGGRATPVAILLHNPAHASSDPRDLNLQDHHCLAASDSRSFRRWHDTAPADHPNLPS